MIELEIKKKTYNIIYLGLLVESKKLFKNLYNLVECY